MYANTTALKLSSNDELIERLSSLVNELNYVDLDDDANDDVSYLLCNIRAIADVLEDRVQSTETEE